MQKKKKLGVRSWDRVRVRDRVRDRDRDRVRNAFCSACKNMRPLLNSLERLSMTFTADGKDYL